MCAHDATQIVIRDLFRHVGRILGIAAQRMAQAAVDHHDDGRQQAAYEHQHAQRSQQ
ncbi:hypothetical protein D3C72_1910610 [compost metagenome]